VIVVRLTASRPGQISFEARLQTAQRATVEATTGGDLVMRGVNGDGPGTTADGRPMTGALRFEARVRLMATGGTRSSSRGAVAVRGGRFRHAPHRAATSYRRFDDAGGDPAALVASALDAAGRKTFDTLRAAHVRDYLQLFNRVTLDLGAGANAPTDERVRAFAGGTDPDWRRSTSSTDATCSSPAHDRDPSRPTCRGSGTRASRRHGAASTRSTSIPR
jgi:alpha-L-fucosidase 2